MTESKHTPGPWGLLKMLSGSENDKGWAVSPLGIGLYRIAEVSPLIKNSRGDASEEGEANAKLIAAAPELLEALKYMEQGHRSQMSDEESDLVFSALALAGVKADAE